MSKVAICENGQVISFSIAQDTEVMDLFSGKQSVSKGFGVNLMGVMLLIEVCLFMRMLLQYIDGFKGMVFMVLRQRTNEGVLTSESNFGWSGMQK